MEKRKVHVFISYGRGDAAGFAAKLAQWLRSQGYEPWLDVENGTPIGSPFDIRIELGISDSDLLIAVLSPWSLRPEGFCRNELLFAQAKRVPIVPIRVAEVDPPIQIISLNYLDVAGNPEEAFVKLPALLEQVCSTRTVGRRQLPGAEHGEAWWTTLPQLDFEAELARHGGAFAGREWLFEKLRAWAARRESRILLLTADAGVGKSAIAAQLTARLNVKGVHFCSRSNVESCRPPAWIGSLARQLAAQLRPYRQQVERVPPQERDEPSSLLRTVIADPLRRCAGHLDISEPWVFVVDGLDEAVAAAGPDLAELLADPDVTLPDWIRVIVTCRPDTSLLAMFKIDGVHRDHLDAEGDGNLRDLKRYVERRVAQAPTEILAAGEQNRAIARLNKLAEGNFLFAKMTLDALCDPDPEYRITTDEIGSLPTALGGLYHAMFRKRFRDVARYEQELLPLIECLVAAPPGALPEGLLLDAGGVDRRSARKGLRALSQFLQHTRAGIALFHKSLSDWLSDESSSAEFSALPERGHHVLADYCWKQYQEGVDEMSEYSVRYALLHLEKASRTEELGTLAEDVAFRHRRYILRIPEIGDDLAPAIHGYYLDLCKRKGWPMSYDQEFETLPDDIKHDNAAAGSRIPKLLLEVGLYVVRQNQSARGQEASMPEHVARAIVEDNLERLAEAEHEGWRHAKLSQGWRHGPVRGVAAKTHPSLLPFREMEERKRENERDAIRNWIDILALAGYTIGDEPPR